MRITLLCVGAVKRPLDSPVREYQERASRYWTLRVREVPAARGRGEGEAEIRDVLRREGEHLLRWMPERGEVVALTRTGSSLDSITLAKTLSEWALRGMSEVTFILGGAYGLSHAVLARCSRRWSLSELTLPHELARLVLLEQLYRAGTILRNEPYHKGPRP